MSSAKPTPLSSLSISLYTFSTMEYSEDQAGRYSKNREKYNETDAKVLQALKSTGIAETSVLDFGCGDGRHALFIAASGAKEVVGIDENPKMIGLANRTVDSKVSYQVANGENLSLFTNGRFDRVFSNFVLHYFSNEAVALSEVARVLKVGGFFVGTFNVCEVQADSEELYNTYMPIRLGQGTESIVVQNLIKSESSMKTAIENAGLKIQQWEELQHPNASIDDGYKYLDKVTKKVILCVAQKSPANN